MLFLLIPPENHADATAKRRYRWTPSSHVFCYHPCPGHNLLCLVPYSLLSTKQSTGALQLDHSICLLKALWQPHLTQSMSPCSGSQPYAIWPVTSLTSFPSSSLCSPCQPLPTGSWLYQQSPTLSPLYWLFSLPSPSQWGLFWPPNTILNTFPKSPVSPTTLLDSFY